MESCEKESTGKAGEGCLSQTLFWSWGTTSPAPELGVRRVPLSSLILRCGWPRATGSSLEFIAVFSPKAISFGYAPAMVEYGRNTTSGARRNSFSLGSGFCLKPPEMALWAFFNFTVSSASFSSPSQPPSLHLHQRPGWHSCLRALLVPSLFFHSFFPKQMSCTSKAVLLSGSQRTPGWHSVSGLTEISRHVSQCCTPYVNLLWLDGCHPRCKVEPQKKPFRDWRFLRPRGAIFYFTFQGIKA